jgi:hypothetical protein
MFMMVMAVVTMMAPPVFTTVIVFVVVITTVAAYLTTLWCGDDDPTGCADGASYDGAIASTDCRSDSSPGATANRAAEHCVRVDLLKSICASGG